MPIFGAAGFLNPAELVQRLNLFGISNAYIRGSRILKSV
jgi:hypothetical protein